MLSVKYIGLRRSLFILSTAFGGSYVHSYLTEKNKYLLLPVRRSSCDRESNNDENSGRKRLLVANHCIDNFVKSNMNISVSTGSIGLFSISRLSQKLKNKELTDINVVPCSEDIKKKCISLGIPVCSLSDIPTLDLAITGADEIDQSMTMIKGKTGSFVREKMVEQAAKFVIVLIDDSKLTRGLGPGAPLPVEIVPFSHQHVRKKIESLSSLQGCRAVLRRGNINNNKSDGINISISI